jgi:hypothetical protein
MNNHNLNNLSSFIKNNNSFSDFNILNNFMLDLNFSNFKNNKQQGGGNGVKDDNIDSISLLLNNTSLSSIAKSTFYSIEKNKRNNLFNVLKGGNSQPSNEELVINSETAEELVKNVATTISDASATAEISKQVAIDAQETADKLLAEAKTPEEQETAIAAKKAANEIAEQAVSDIKEANTIISEGTKIINPEQTGTVVDEAIQDEGKIENNQSVPIAEPIQEEQPIPSKSTDAQDKQFFAPITVIPKGTILYHSHKKRNGFNQNRLKFGDTSLITFFTPNFRLASDNIGGCSLEDKEQGYIHAFEVKEDITNIYIAFPDSADKDLGLEELSTKFCGGLGQYNGVGFYYPINEIELFSKMGDYLNTTEPTLPPNSNNIRKLNNENLFYKEYALCNPDAFLKYLYTHKCIGTRKLSEPFAMD